VEKWLENGWTMLQSALPVAGRALGVIVVSFILVWAIRRMLGTAIGTRLLPQQLLLVRSVASYTVYGAGAVLVLKELGFDPKVLLGAAGFLTVAIGFASQTSVSNLISGLFLIFERPFVIGDTVMIDGVTGEVLSIDLLSIKLRTFDNLYVRVPNESVLKTRVTTMTRYPIRRIDLTLSVTYGSDLAKIEEILLGIAAASPRILQEPRPLYLITSIEPPGVDIRFSIWVERDAFIEVRNEAYRAILDAFDKAGITIPPTQHAITTGSPTPQPDPS
jgi:small-conductance mechanosensitive channel